MDLPSSCRFLLSLLGLAPISLTEGGSIKGFLHKVLFFSRKVAVIVNLIYQLGRASALIHKVSKSTHSWRFICGLSRYYNPSWMGC